MLDYEEVLALVDDECKRIRVEKNPEGWMYVAPEAIPGIESSQIKAVVRVMVKLLNERYE